MLYKLQGIIEEASESSVVVRVSGVSFFVQVPRGYNYSLQSTATIFTHFHWHAEQGPSIFGFSQPLDRQVFVLLISCSGIGPKIGLALLGHEESPVILTMLIQGDARGLSKTPGLGLKKAETLIMHCRDKALKLLEHVPAGKNSSHCLKEVHDALESLGYSRQEISASFESLQEFGPLSFDEALRKALSYLSVKRV